MSNLKLEDVQVGDSLAWTDGAGKHHCRRVFEEGGDKVMNGLAGSTVSVRFALSSPIEITRFASTVRPPTTL